MFHSISWHSYWITVTSITFVYYVFVYIVYFKGNLKVTFDKSDVSHFGFINSNKKEEQPLSSLFDNHNKATDGFNAGEEYLFHSCIDELNAFFENQKKSKAVKSELMFALYNILQKYPSLKNSEYKESITNIIATQCENICSVHLMTDELKGVWIG